ncbi:stress response protein NST1-like [Zingiber officinale]|uniref:Uncharacterized protein n=1 Tax=Zingiber officinale TaxID=94328 RepID=A0A8J5G705_ZINOF|nr:stress response protein NST1-like [Zingiber officinale]KAG6501141.1 hypothetical protein ZIOFF_041010 [Zingiber officinale]
MSALVDYAASDEEEEIDEVKESAAPPLSSPAPPRLPASIPPPNSRNRGNMATNQHPNVISPLPPPSLEGLPSVSALFAAPSPALQSNQMVGNDHSSRVAAAVAESASRKRQENGSNNHQPPKKHPRGKLLHLRNVPDTHDGSLVPPQLRGRSNVVTEDIGKLFVSRRTE